MSTGTLISVYRRLAKLSVEELAAKLEIPVERIASIEADEARIKPHELSAIAVALNRPEHALSHEHAISQRVQVSVVGNASDESIQAVKDKLIDYLVLDEYLEKQGISNG